MPTWNEATTPPPPPVGTPDAQERQWAMFAHLSAIVGGLLTSQAMGGIGCVLGPLIIWQMKKDTMPFVTDQAKEALNFNITVALAMLVLVLLGVGTFGVGFLVTAPLMLILGLAALVLVIVAGIKANAGEAYRYPFALRLVK
ncbi:MAG TPA: DUF4870 domain-containing protein [Xanthomonadaceae bacterium]|jgi:uncharacterized Tic20 family protein|nr:DUF4870 domain-containing protein [Xanthomonadaceae bacterium]